MGSSNKQTENDGDRDQRAVKMQADLHDEPKSLIYGILDVPPPGLFVLFSFQQYLLGLGATFLTPLVVSDLICARDQPDAKAVILSTSMFVCGISTIIQTLFGVRLGIFQGSSFAFLTPVVVMVATDTWKCSNEDLTSDDAWKKRMREIQGNLILASLTQILLGCTGVIGFLRQYIGPLTIAPVLALLVLTVIDVFISYCESNWGITFLVTSLMVIFSLFLAKYKIPFPVWSPKKGCHIFRLQLFQLLPVFLSVIISWIVCLILTETDSLPTNSTLPGYRARTDAQAGVIDRAPWFFWPYPFQFGMPTFSGGMYVGFLAACIASVIESLGDYYAAAEMSGVPVPPAHAINRGIAMEGIGCVLAGMFGAGHGVTSYSHNIAAFEITKVASRSIFILLGFLFIISGVVGKFGALLATIPDPIIGGILISTLGIIVAVGFAFMRFTEINSNRSLYILGLTIITGMVVPRFITDPRNNDVIDTGNAELDLILKVLLGSPMLIGGALGFFLDNIVPGTDAERGIKNMLMDNSNAASGSDVRNVYQIPFISSFIKRISCFSRIPISPTFESTLSSECCRSKKRYTADKEQEYDNKVISDDEVFTVTHM